MKMIKIKSLLLLVLAVMLVPVITGCSNDNTSVEDKYVVEIVDYLVRMSAFPDDLNISYITLAKDDENGLYYYEIFFSGKSLNYENLEEPGEYYENSMLYVVNIINDNLRDIVISQDYDKYPDLIESYGNVVSVTNEIEYYAEDIAEIMDNKNAS